MRLIDADALERALGYLWVVTTSRDTDDKETSLERAAMCRGIDDCIGIAQRAPTVGGWISVKDRLPEEEGLYLCWFGKNKYTKGALICNYIADLGGFGSLISLETFDKITHWMPLPEGPEEGEAGE